MKVALSVATAILMWSLYPLLTSFALEEISAVSLVLATQAISAVIAIILTGYLLLRHRKLRQFVKIHRSLDGAVWLNILASGASSAFNHVLFAFAMGLAYQGGVALIYDSWPIMAVFMTPFLLQRQWDDLSARDYLLGLVAIVGIGFIVFSDQNMDVRALFSPREDGSFDYMSLLGYVLAALGGYMCALVVLTKPAVSLAFEDLRHRGLTVLISEVWSRSIGTALLLLAAWGMNETIAYTGTGLGFAFALAFGVLILGGGLQTYVLLKARNPNVSLFYYLIPLLGVFWLVVTGQITVNLAFLAGAVLVIGASVVLFWQNKRSRDADRAREHLMKESQ